MLGITFVFKHRNQAAYKFKRYGWENLKGNTKQAFFRGTWSDSGIRLRALERVSTSGKIETRCLSGNAVQKRRHAKKGNNNFKFQNTLVLLSFLFICKSIVWKPRHHSWIHEKGIKIFMPTRNTFKIFLIECIQFKSVSFFIFMTIPRNVSRWQKSRAFMASHTWKSFLEINLRTNFVALWV